MTNKGAILFLIAITVIGVSLYFLIGRPVSPKLESQTSEANGVNFEVTPLDFNIKNPVKFEIKIDTHSGSLDFDLVKISSLEDDLGNKYQPLEWQGPAPGGHHLAGIILFPKLTAAPKELKLIIQDKTPRIFNWNLK